MPLIPFPNVPQVPGVPALPRSITVPTSLTSLVGLAAEIYGDYLAPAWGVLDSSGRRVLVPDSFLELRYRKDERQADYPMEQGQFASYNKVNMPYDCRITMAISSDQGARTQFLATCAQMLTGTELYTVQTPDATYVNASLVNYTYSRTRRDGISQIIVELSFREVRSNAVTTTVQTSQPDGASQVSDGSIQTMPLASVPSIVGTAIQ